MTTPAKPWYLPTLESFLLEDVPRVVGLSPAAFVADVKTLHNRVAQEGESFLTKTLPRFAKSIDFALQERAPLTVDCFKKRKRNSALPAFLQALTRRVFMDDGRLAPHPCIDSIRLLRQIGYWCKKIEKGFTDESLQAAVHDLEEVDRRLPDVSLRTNPGLLGRARVVLGMVLHGIRGVHSSYPHHGPGSVAWCEREPAHCKRLVGSHCYTDLEEYFRPVPWFFSLRDTSESPELVTGRYRTKYGLSKLAFVEKDSSGPRVIGLEPVEYMWCQQALKELLYDHIESRSIARGQINFTDQEVNRELTAHWPTHDTLDMSKASDRNSLSLFKVLFSKTSIYRALLASRTPGVVLPDGRILWYKKFAPMGSATCFPVEALTFYSLAVASLWKAGYPLLLALKNVFVYGDDLVVPHGYFSHFQSDFESVGLKFSDEKCCVSGKFRESCGLDSYDGQSVTPIRLRRPYGKTPSTLVSLVEHANALMTAGYESSARVFRRLCQHRFPKLVKMNIPIVTQTAPVLAWFDPGQGNDNFPLKLEDGGIVKALGWQLKQRKLKLHADAERSVLREVLSRGGTVGCFHKHRGCWERLVDLREQDRLVRAWFYYTECEVLSADAHQIKGAPQFVEQASYVRWALRGSWA